MLLKEASYVFRNGLPTDVRPLSEHHIFTTLRISSGAPELWKWHESRLIRDARILGVVWDVSRITEIRRVARELFDGVIRISCTETDWWIHGWIRDVDEKTPLSSVWIDWEHRAPLPVSSKHGYRSSAVQRAKDLNVDVLLWRDAKGYVLEASFGNLFSIVDGCLYTPPARGQILDGIGRRSVIAAAQKIGMLVREEDILYTHGGWWMTSALRGIQNLDISTEHVGVEELRRAVHDFRKKTL